MPRVLSFTASQKDEGRRVRDVIREDFSLVAHDIARAKYRTERGITVDGETVLVNRVLRAGEVLEIRLGYENPGKIVPVPGPLEILYEDEDVLVVNKPAGLVVHPSHGHFSDTLSNYVSDYYIRKQEPHEVRPAGRLDKDTSGLVFFGKSRTAAAHLSGQAGKIPVRKTYLAAASGFFAVREGCISFPISREYEEKIRRVVREDGDRAVTHFRVVRQYEDYALVLLQLETGRTHQIRVHMKHIGHPLVGDAIYNENESTHLIGRAALHAWRAEFGQPFTKEMLEITAPLPEDMRRLCGDTKWLLNHHTGDR